MATTTPSAALVPVAPVFTNTERLALAGFLAAYSGLTRQAYELDLRQFAGWCQQHQLCLFQARRADIEFFARDLEARGRARATITRRLCTVAGFYRYAAGEELLDHSPAAYVRRPRLDYESHATGLDRNELGALLVTAGLGPPAEHALIALLALNGLRVSEATSADIDALGIERGHRTLVITRKGGKVVTIPLAPRTARAIDLAIGERSEGPIFLAADGRRLDRHGAGRVVRRIARRAGITKTVRPHTLRHAFITAALDAGVPLRDVHKLVRPRPRPDGRHRCGRQLDPLQCGRRDLGACRGKAQQNGHQPSGNTTSHRARFLRLLDKLSPHGCRRVLGLYAQQVPWPAGRAVLVGLRLVKRVLLTGMSGTGKSSVIRALAVCGYKAIDTDDGWSQPLPDGRQQWREDAIAKLLATEDTGVLFVAGCEENQVQFHPQFDIIILLSAPSETLIDRLAARNSNPYGKAPEELSRVLADLRDVEPLLRHVADHEVRTTMPLDDVVTTILRLADA